jgi:hypothetical protein
MIFNHELNLGQTIREWKFLHLQKLAHRKKSLPPKGRRPAGGKAFLPTGEVLGEVFIPETHGPFGNCIPVRVNQVIKGIEISQWPLHI